VRTVGRWVRETTGGLPRQFWYLWATTLINRMGSFVLIVLALYLTQERGLSEWYAGLVIGLWGAGAAVGTMVGGVLADRWGRKPTLLTALFGSAAMMLLLGLVESPIAIAVCSTLTGMVGEAFRPAVSALMVDIVREEDRARAFSINYWVINLGFAFSATLAGLLIGVDVRLLFLLDAATTVAAAVWVALRIREPVRASHPATAAGPSAVDKASAPRPGLGAVLRDRVFLSFVGMNLLIALVFLQHFSTLPMTMARDGLPASTFGQVIALNGVLIVVGQLFVTRAMRRLDQTTALAVASVVIGVGFGLTTFAGTPAFYAITVLVWTTGEMFHAPSNATTVAALSPAALRGRYQGVFSLSWSVASFIAPLLGAVVLQYGGKAGLWLGCLGLSLVAAALTLASRSSREQRAAELSAATAAPAPPAAPAAAAAEPARA
jgi:MFS family permease